MSQFQGFKGEPKLSLGPIFVKLGPSLFLSSYLMTHSNLISVWLESTLWTKFDGRAQKALQNFIGDSSALKLQPTELPNFVVLENSSR